MPGGCQRIGIFSKIKASKKNYRRHIVDIPRIILFRITKSLGNWGPACGESAPSADKKGIFGQSPRGVGLDSRAHRFDRDYLVTNSEIGNFLQDQENQWIARRHTTVRCTWNPED